MGGFTDLSKEQQKVMARYQLILDMTGDAHGDAARTAGSFTNQMRALKSKAEDLAITVGKEIIPHLTVWVKLVGDWISNNKEMIRAGTKEFLLTLSEALKGLVEILKVVIKYWEWFALAVGALVAAKVITGLASIASGVFSIGKAAVTAASSVAALAAKLIAVESKGAAAKAALGGVGKAAGLLGVAAAAGFGIGTLIDRWTGASDKLSSIMVAAEKRMSRMRKAQFEKSDASLRLKEQAQQYRKMMQAGVKSIQVAGGGRAALNPETVRRQLEGLAKRLGVSDDVKGQIPSLVDESMGWKKPAATSSKQVNIGAPNVTVNLPAGTTAAQANAVGKATGDALQTALTRTAGDVAR
jgi:hypothetical protein